VTVIERIGERPDADGKFFFPWRADCQFENDGWGCSWRNVFYTKEAATWGEATHQHFKTYQEGRYNYLSIAERYWIELDSVIDQIKELGIDPGNPNTFKIQGRATGLAFALVHACQPYYADETAVLKESNKRWKIRNQQMDWEPTPGFKYDPPIPGANARILASGPDEPVRVNTRARGEHPAAAAAKKLKPADQEAIKRGMGSGMFKADDLAQNH
jgi:hypothetical protein